MRGRRARVLLIAGKGGVGKTTVAAATGLHFAQEGMKTLVVSIDPVHALSTIFDKEIGDKIVQIQKNLFAVELDAEKISRKVDIEYKRIFREAFAGWLEDIIKDIPVEILSGIGDIFALGAVERFSREKWDVIVLDTAPTGTTLRLLRLSRRIAPALSRALSLYRRLLHPWQTLKAWLGGKPTEPKIVTTFREIHRSAENIEKMLASGKTELILVINPEVLPLKEARQLRREAEEHGLTVRKIVVNKIITPCKCTFCSERRAEQQRYLEAIKKEYEDIKIMEIPYLSKEIITIDRIKECMNLLFK